jgi:hypothetical protein
LKWNEAYSSEEALLNALVKVDIELYKKNYCKGYEYVESFQKYYNQNGSLTPRQMTQLKRVAREIKRYEGYINERHDIQRY